MGKLYNLARMSSRTAGTGAVVLDAPIPGCLSFDDAGVQNGDVVSYGISEGIQSEVGYGTYTTATKTLSRDTVIASTNGGAPIVLIGEAQVYVTLLAEDMPDLSPLTAKVNISIREKFR